MSFGSPSSAACYSHSARVAIELRLPDRTLQVAQLGPDFLILVEPINYPPCEATVVLSVDDTVRQYSVALPQGISHSEVRVMAAHVKESDQRAAIAA